MPFVIVLLAAMIRWLKEMLLLTILLVP